MKGFKNYITNTTFSQILQIIILFIMVTIGIHFMLAYFKKNIPLPNIRVLEERVRLRKKV